MLKKKMKQYHSTENDKNEQKPKKKKYKKLKRPVSNMQSVKKNAPIQFSQYALQKKRIRGQSAQFLEARKQSYLNSCFHKRKRALIEITKENQKLYQRINSQQSQYCSQKAFNRSHLSHKSISFSRRSQQCQQMSHRSSKSKQIIRPSSFSKLSRQRYIKNQRRILKIESQNINNIKDSEVQNCRKMFQIKSQSYKSVGYSEKYSKFKDNKENLRKIDKQNLIIEEIEQDIDHPLTKYTNVQSTNILAKSNVNNNSIQNASKRRILSAVQRPKPAGIQKVIESMKRKWRG